MKNKIDIRKLIKKKYNDNTFELSDLFEEIDLVLNEGIIDYSYKRDLSTLEEDPKQAIRVANVVNGNSVPINQNLGAPRNQRSNSDQDRWYHADKIAEADEDKKSANSNISTKEIKVSVPDIFSLITNSQMKLRTNDRNLLNDIVENIKRDPRNSPPSWNNTLKSFEAFLNEQGAIDLSNLSLQEAASKLIYFNVLKKISQYTAQPGKLFEYIIAPLISKDVEVLGSFDTNIIDISDGMGKDYSIKFYTGTKSNLVFAGSYENLKKYCEPENKPVRDVHYIIGRVVGNNLIFARFYVSTSLDYFSKKDNNNQDVYSPAISKSDYQVFNMMQGRSGPGIGIYIRPKEEALQLRKQSSIITQSFKNDENLKTLNSERSKILNRMYNNTYNLQSNTPLTLKVAKEQNGKKTEEDITLSNAKWDDLKDMINNHLNGNDLELKNAKNYKTDEDGRIVIADPADPKKNKIHKDDAPIIQIYNTIFKDLDSSRVEDLVSDIEKYQTNYTNIMKAKDETDRKEVERKILDRKKEILATLSSQNISIPQIIPDEEDEEDISASEDPNIVTEQETTKKQKKYTFAFPLKNLIEENKLIDINLGEPKKYNEYQVKIGNQLQEWMINSLENYSKLGSNLTSYFVQGVEEKVPSAKNLAKEAIQNANDIASDVGNIAKSKKHPT